MRQRALSPASGAGTRQAAEGGGVEGGQPGWLRGGDGAEDDTASVGFELR